MNRIPVRDATADTRATYVFAVCGRLDPAVLSGLRGLADDRPVRVLPLGSLTAVVQHVSAAEYGEAAWQERLADARELERVARAHHEVVTAVAARGPTVPLPLATLYRGDDRARTALGQDAARFHTALRRIEGRVEWGVKVYAPATPKKQESEPAPGQRGRPAPGAGRAYLDRKRGLHQQRERRLEDALGTADTVDLALRELAAAGRRLRTHQDQGSPARGTQVLNATYLVDADRAGDIARAVRDLRRLTGADIEMTGPWAPYSFAGDE